MNEIFSFVCKLVKKYVFFLHQAISSRSCFFVCLFVVDLVILFLKIFFFLMRENRLY